MPLIRCSECSKRISDKAAVRPSCGHPMKQIHVVNHDLAKKPSGGLAAVLSFIIPGLGQLYCGRFW